MPENLVGETLKYSSQKFHEKGIKNKKDTNQDILSSYDFYYNILTH